MTTAKMEELISPYGGELVNLLIPEEEFEDKFRYAGTLPGIQLSPRATCDFELLAVGGYSPLDRFMQEDDFRSVLDTMRLADDTLFPIPITLPVEHDDIEGGIQVGMDIALRDPRNELLGIMTIEEMYSWDHHETSDKVFGTRDLRHPLVAEMHRWGKYNISGELQALRLPQHHDFVQLRLPPHETRLQLMEFGKKNIVAFQTRNPLHRVHEEITKRAIADIDGALLLHPVVGLTRPGDIDHFTRVRTYKVLASQHYEPGTILLGLLPLAMRFAGPREAIWHAIIRRNYGANYFIVGRDHAGPGADSRGDPIYAPYEAQKMVADYREELGVEMLPFQTLVYLQDEQRYEEVDKVRGGIKAVKISGSEVREEYLRKGKEIPDWYMRGEVAKILTESYPPKHKDGFCVWFTGLCGAGKSTIAEILAVILQEFGRQVTVLDGDVVRTNLSKGLGFSKIDRDINIRRIGFVASEIVRHRGVAICAAVSPYRATRNDVRSLFGKDQFFEVFVDTPLEVCEQRDVKGLYAAARRGEIVGFTGIDDPYEEPRNPEIRIETEISTPYECARLIINILQEDGFLIDADRRFEMDY
jgi:sulfate adenylyltransferase